MFDHMNDTAMYNNVFDACRCTDGVCETSWDGEWFTCVLKMPKFCIVMFHL